jgi:hypothetical protein
MTGPSACTPNSHAAAFTCYPSCMLIDSFPCTSIISPMHIVLSCSPSAHTFILNLPPFDQVLSILYISRGSCSLAFHPAHNQHRRLPPSNLDYHHSDSRIMVQTTTILKGKKRLRCSRSRATQETPTLAAATSLPLISPLLEDAAGATCVHGQGRWRWGPHPPSCRSDLGQHEALLRQQS